MSRIDALLALAVLLAAGPAAAIEPTDFAFGAELATPGSAPIRSLEVPTAVYRDAVSPRLDDLAVFNADGQPVPLRLTHPRTRPGTAPAAVELPAFPLRVQGQSGSRRLEIITRDDGTLIRSDDESATRDRVTAWVVDLGGLESPPTRITLQWQRPTDAGFAGRLAVFAGDDLADWRKLVARAAVADLAADGTRLVRRRIDLPPTEARYLRIDWPTALAEVTLEGVEAGFEPRQAPRPRNWLRPAPRRAADPADGYRLDIGGRFPVDRARLESDARNFVRQLRLESRPTAAAPWQPRARGGAHRLAHDGLVLESDPLAFPPNGDRQWRLALEPDPGRPPVLALGWVAHRLTFVAEGPGPYTLAWGSHESTRHHRPAAGLLAGLDGGERERLAGPATAGEPFALGGAGRLQPPRAPFPWSRVVLWGVLLGGLSILAWMVRQLLRRPPGSGD